MSGTGKTIMVETFWNESKHFEYIGELVFKEQSILSHGALPSLFVPYHSSVLDKVFSEMGKKRKAK